ncbi:MAG: alpha-1,2-fucosyltransferase, partial [Cyclobacteriaceae bacterium]
MIKVIIRGGLGNQMFQFAFAYAVAKKLRTFYLMDKIFRFKLHEYFQLGWFGKFLRNKYGYFLYTKFSNRCSFPLKVVDDWHCPGEFQFVNNSVYDGFYQSQNYFKQYQSQVKELFQIREVHRDKFDRAYGDLYEQNKILVIHIRRTDYLSFGNEQLGGKDLSLPWNYYQSALNKIDSLETYTILVIGDDLDFARKNLKWPAEYLNNEEVVDFQILQNAELAIISNSTFAWWARFLSKNFRKTYAPEYWLG